MADIDLVIKIPENTYKRIQALSKDDYFEHDICGNSMRRIAEGTPLPVGHGDLTDKNYLLNILQCEEYENCTWRNCSECNRERCIKRYDVLNAPTIIKAESEIKDEFYTNKE